MNKEGGLGRRLWRAFTLQAIFISITAVLSVLVAGLSIKEVMIKQALRDESSYYWESREGDPDFPLPDTRNLTGYLAGQSKEVPSDVAHLAPGFHDLPGREDFSLAYVTDRDGHRLILIFDGERVGVLVLWFGIIPLAAVLVILYLISLFSYRATRRAISPIVDLARHVDRLDPSAADETGETIKVSAEADVDTQMLARALNAYAERLRTFVARERDFTRDASHELRSPLTVIRIAADMLLTEQELTHPAQNSVHRIKSAVDDMEELTEAFLMLARESDSGLSSDPVSVNKITEEELATVQLQVSDKPIEFTLEQRCQLVVEAPDQILGVLIGNILRNAGNYTDQGSVLIRIDEEGVTVRDSGVGIEPENLERIFTPFDRGTRRRRGGHGVGLTIVKRISDRFDWPVDIKSQPNVGTTVHINFPNAEVVPLSAATA